MTIQSTLGLYPRHVDDAGDVRSVRRLECEECGRVSRENERGWRAYLTDDEEEPKEAVVYCRECDDREFRRGRLGRKLSPQLPSWIDAGFAFLVPMQVADAGLEDLEIHLRSAECQDTTKSGFAPDQITIGQRRSVKSDPDLTQKS